MSYAEVFLLSAPEWVIALTALVALGVDLVAMRGTSVRSRMLVVGTFICFGCAAAMVLLLVGGAHGHVGEGMLVASSLASLVKLALVALTLFTVVISFDADFTDHVGEYYALLLLATCGMMFLVSTDNLLMIFVALELISLSLYVLTAFNKQNPHSTEAALKYFLFGGMAAAMMLFGVSLVYGLSGSIYLPEIAAKLKGQGTDPLLMLGLVMTVVGLGFKIAAVPFHLWAPDAYQGAPTTCAAFIASGSKLASFTVLAKVMMVGFAGAEGSAVWRGFAPGWMSLLAVVATLSLTLGNLAALAQTNVKRLLAYSAIAHAGYALLSVLANDASGVAAMVYYMTTYGLTIIGAFAVVAVVERATGGSDLVHFAGLSQRAPLLALCLMVFILSLAGIPPLAGFFGKFYVFIAALNGKARDLGLLWLVIFALAMSCVSLYYYLQVLKQAYVKEPGESTPISVPIPTLVAVVMLAGLVVLLGCMPDLLLAELLAALQGGH